MNREMKLIKSLISEISMGPFGSDIKVEFFVDEGIPVLNGSNVGGVKLSEESFKYLTKDKADSLKKANAKRGDIIITHRGTLGQISYIPQDSKQERYVISQSQFRVTLKKDLVDPAYFTYYFHTTEGQKRLLSFKNHVGVPALAQATTNFRLLEFPWIPLSDQQKIASVLSSLDSKIELNNKINAELEAMAKLIYDYWFVQFDFPISAAQATAMGKPELAGKPYKSSGGPMVYNQTLKREIPEGWEDAILGDIMTLQRGVTYNKDDIRNKNSKGVTPVLRATNISGNVIDLNDMVYVPSKLVSDNQKMATGDILITMSSGSKDHIGKNGMFHFEEEVGFGAFCARIIPKERYRSFLYSYMQSEFMNATIKNECLGTNINNLNGSLVKGFKLILPDDSTLKRFEVIVSPFFEKIGINLKQNQELRSLRDWLLPMLMNGQVSIKEAEEHPEIYRESMAADERGDYGK
tara:strand:- start:2885 stop:4279 length:1395 start_codon:yes stop_codon:yes gene_type:complete